MTSTSDVADWVRNGATAALQKANVKVGGAGPTVRIRVDQISLSESVYRRAEYNGRIALTVDVISSVSCRRRVRSSRNANRSALDRAMIKLLGDSDFDNALCNCK